MVFPTHGYREATPGLPCSYVILPWRRLLGDALSWRRFLLATPRLGNACTWRHPTWATPFVDFDLDVDFDHDNVNAWVRDGTITK